MDTRISCVCGRVARVSARGPVRNGSAYSLSATVSGGDDAALRQADRPPRVAYSGRLSGAGGGPSAVMWPTNPSEGKSSTM